MRKKRDTAKTQQFFNTARLPKYPTFRASPSEGTAENHLHKNSSQVGCVKGRAHARAESQHASGAYGPGRILSCLRQHTRPGPRKGGVPTVEILQQFCCGFPAGLGAPKIVFASEERPKRNRKKLQIEKKRGNKYEN